MEDIIISSKITIPASTVSFTFSRSGGKGGQNVNKVSTRVELYCDISGIRCSERIRSLIRHHLSNRLDSGGILRIVAQDSRSQWQNKQRAIERLIENVAAAAKEETVRIATRPTRASKSARIEVKKKSGRQKILRQKNFLSSME
ncbi:MAG: alternative ribosome rescue aminoacyl-tRNA hydrolase ArfB [Bacteroidota bacterium]